MSNKDRHGLVSWGEQEMISILYRCSEVYAQYLQPQQRIDNSASTWWGSRKGVLLVFCSVSLSNKKLNVPAGHIYSDFALFLSLNSSFTRFLSHTAVQCQSFNHKLPTSSTVTWTTVLTCPIPQKLLGNFTKAELIQTKSRYLLCSSLLCSTISEMTNSCH